MSDLLDHLYPVVIGSALLAVMCAFGWLKTGYRGLAVATVVLILFSIGMVLLERLTITDREQVEQTMEQIARDVERGDLEKILSHVHPDAPETRNEAAQELPQYKIKSVRIKRGMRIEFHPRHDPPEAVAEFNVVVTGSDAGELVGESQVPRFVTVRLWKDGDLWKVRSYRHDDPLEGMRNRP